MLSGWLPLRARGALARSTNGRAGARVLVCHSAGDEEVDVGCARLASKLLVAAGSAVDFKALGHQLHVASETSMWNVPSWGRHRSLSLLPGSEWRPAPWRSGHAAQSGSLRECRPQPIRGRGPNASLGYTCGF